MLSRVRTASVFLATPLVVDIKKRFSKDVQEHDKSVIELRTSESTTKTVKAAAD